MRQQDSIHRVDKIMYKYIIGKAELEIVFRVLNTIVYYAQGIQGFSEIIFKLMKIQLT